MKKNYIALVIPVAALALTSCIHGTKKENSKTGFVKIDDVTLVSSDLKASYAPSKGAVKMLVIPIAFTGTAKDADSAKYTDWNEDNLGNMYDYYFGESSSLSTYYATASLNNVQVSGKVTDVYENSTIKTSTILEDNTFASLWDMIEDAISWVCDNDESINWSEYDLNQDGCIDNIHLITNYTAANEEWGQPLWPHMYYTGRTGTVEKPMANVYSISGIGFVEDPYTAIHEQGHIFGLEDYYDYTEDSQLDYVGQLDMQSYTVFDWNSFSKLSMGWVKPYVINGEANTTTVNIKAASINGDCILVPADYSTWNGSAFDEYFLIELFAPYGNNKKDWPEYQNSLGARGGIRVYHVDARVYGGNTYEYFGDEDYEEDEKIVVTNMEEQQINTKDDVAKWNTVAKGATNSSLWHRYPGGISQLADYPLLSIVQKGGDFTFAQQNGRHTLNSIDLFKVGDEFTWEKYSKFLNKNGEKQELTNKGEVFPYKFVIDYLDEDDATITFTKVK